MEKGLSKSQLISQLTKSPHGDLAEYIPLASRGAAEAQEFYAHLTAWNALHGQIRDAKIALPVLGLQLHTDAEFRENALAQLAALDPRSLVTAIHFAHGWYWTKTTTDVKAPKGKKTVKSVKWTRHRASQVNISRKLLHRFVERYLLERERNSATWTSAVISQRSAMRELYRWAHRIPGGSADAWQNRVLMHREYIPGSAFQAVKDLAKMSPVEAVQAINKHKIPTLVFLPALGERLKDTDVALQVIESMSPTELVTNIKLFEKFGWKNVPALRAALDKALEKVTASKKNVLKTGRMAETREIGDELKAKLHNTQEKQLDQNVVIKGNWLILGDRSPSMQIALDATKEVAAFMGRAVEGDTHVIFFDNSPRYFNVTGKTLEQVKHEMRHVAIEGSGTSIGVGLQYAIDNNLLVEGIAVLTDAQENTAPFFAERYKKYCDKFDIEPSVYLYRFQPTMHAFMDRDLGDSLKKEGIEFNEFDLRGGVDHYSLPNLAKTMRPGRYALLDEIMSSPLRRLDDVLTHTAGMEVLKNVAERAQAVGR